MDEMSRTLYQEVRDIAARRLSGDRAEASICATDLVHEALERALRHRSLDGESRGQILGRVSHIVRQVLVDHARRRQTVRRGSGQPVLQLAVDPTVVPDMQPVDLLAVNDALDRLGALDERQARLIEMRYFGGHNVSEVAEALEVSLSTVEKEERKARAWLALALAD